METVTIPKKEYERLKAIEQEADNAFIESIDRSLQDLKKGRISDF